MTVQSFWRQMVKHSWMVALGVTVFAVLAGVSYADVRLTVPEEDPYAPVYARFGVVQEWAFVYFYRPPACVPATFNLLGFFDIPTTYGGGAYRCPLTMEGFEIHQEAPGDLLDPATWQRPLTPPKQSNLHEADDVPVWIMRTADLMYAVAANQGVLTLSKLEAIPSLRKGAARFYHEILHPQGGVKNPLLEIEAHGTLEDGSFQLHAVFVWPGNELNNAVLNIIFK